ncbi:MAG: hypothetical protein AB1752_02220 [Candidatus Zixiibacteriota bacterium]
MGIVDLNNPYQPMGGQPTAIDSLVDGYGRGLKHQTLLVSLGSHRRVPR